MNIKRALLQIVLISGFSCGLNAVGFFCDRSWSDASQNMLNTQVSLNVPNSFGKTHFIVGFPSESIEAERHGVCVQPAPEIPSVKVFFSPDDDIKKELLELINQEQESIKLAMFLFTHIDIARALIDAHNRGVSVEVITDQCCLHDKYNKITLLKEHDFTIYVYDNRHKTGTISNIMHNKFIIFGNTRSNKSSVWTGSLNFTKSAQLSNQENVLVVESRDIVDKFLEQFERIKKRSKPLKI